jgi:hypothetical protein
LCSGGYRIFALNSYYLISIRAGETPPFYVYKVLHKYRVECIDNQSVKDYIYIVNIKEEVLKMAKMSNRKKRFIAVASKMDQEESRKFNGFPVHSEFVKNDKTWDPETCYLKYSKKTTDAEIRAYILADEHLLGEYFRGIRNRYAAKHGIVTETFVKALKEAFVSGLVDHNIEHDLPNEFHPKDYERWTELAEKVLKEEAATGKLRLSALGEFMCINEIDDWKIKAKSCPIAFDSDKWIDKYAYSNYGGKLFADAPGAYTEEYGMQKCLEHSFYSWFSKKYFGN